MRRCDAVSPINTISSIVSVDLDQFAPQPTIDGKERMVVIAVRVKSTAEYVAAIARDPERGPADFNRRRDHARRGGITTRNANVQICTAAMTYGFKIIEELGRV